MPDPSRLYRRVTESNVPTRVIAHLSVVTLVIAASVAGFSNTQGHDGAGPSSDRFLSLVSSVRGAAAPSEEITPIAYDVDAMIEACRVGPRGASVAEVEMWAEETAAFSGFEVRETD